MTKTVFTETYFIAAACCAAPFRSGNGYFRFFAGYGGLLTPKAQESFFCLPPLFAKKRLPREKGVKKPEFNARGEK